MLASFSGSNGEDPEASLTLSGNTLYGTTYYGGAIGDYGTVYSVPQSGGSVTVLTSFNVSDGQGPRAGLTLSGNTLYGTTESGGASGFGTVFSLPLSGGSPTVLASFNVSNGKWPEAGLTLVGNTLYGTTYEGGANGDGTVFSLPLSGGSPTVLISFNGSNGQEPWAGLILNGNTLYGTTEYGGANNDGTVFALNIAPATIALSSGTSATIIRGGTATLGMSVSNSPTSGYNLNYTLNAAVQSGSATLGAITSGTGSLAPSQSQSCTVSAASTSLGVTTISFTGSDPNASNSPQTAAATLTVLDHAAAAFTNSSTVLTLSFGTVHLGSGTQDLQYQIENLPAAYRAGLALESVMALSDPDGLFSTDATPFSDLAPGTTTGLLDLFLNPSQLGNFAGQYQFTLSDEQDLSGWTGGQTLTLNVTAEVVPEPFNFRPACRQCHRPCSLRLEQTETDGQRHYHLRNDLVRRRGRRGHRFQSSHERRKSRDTAHIQRQPLRKGQVWGRAGLGSGRQLRAGLGSGRQLSCQQRVDSQFLSGFHEGERVPPPHARRPSSRCYALGSPRSPPLRSPDSRSADAPGRRPPLGPRHRSACLRSNRLHILRNVPRRRPRSASGRAAADFS